MEAIILCGGMGTRLSSVVNDVPKPMAPIHGQPFLSLLLHRLALNRSLIDEVILATGYMHNVIKNYYGNSFEGLPIRYSVEDKPLGTGGALYKSLSSIQNQFAIVQNADTFINFDLERLIKKEWNPNLNLLLGTKIFNNFRFGALKLKDNLVIGFEEKAIKDGFCYINAGTYLMRKNIMNIIPFKQEQNFSLEKDVLPRLAKNKILQVYLETSNFIDIGLPEDYKRAQTELEPFI